MNTMVDILLGECESIIAEVENVTEYITFNGFNTSDSFFDELLEIRATAEELQSLVVDLENDYFSVTKEELDDLSITLYQNIKYSLEGFENEYFEFICDDTAKSFSYMRSAINTIRSTIK